MTPAEIDAALPAWLPPRVASSIKPERRWRKRDAQELEHSESFIASYDCTGRFEKRDASEALRILELLNARADKGGCVKEIVRLKALTINRASGEDDMAVQIAAMAEELSAYPLDVVCDACRSWANCNKFFPAWSELLVLCEERVLMRRCLLGALQQYFAHRASEQCTGSASDHTGTSVDSMAKGNGREPYSRLWRSLQPALEQKVGTKDYRAWLRALVPVVPHADIGAEYYQLGAPTRSIRDYVASYHQSALEEVLGRPVKLVVSARS